MPEQGYTEDKNTASSPERTRRWLLAVAGLVVLHVTHPLTWGQFGPGVCFLPLGFALALIAWLGPRAVLLVAGDGFLVGLQAWLLGLLPGTEGAFPLLVVLLGEPVLTALEAWAAWTLFTHVCRGPTSLSDPPKAVAFLVIVPGYVAGAAALLQVGLLRAQDLLAAETWWQLPAIWLGRSLGTLAVTPLLLVAITPHLARLKLLAPTWRRFHPERAVTGRLRLGDWIEIIGLALGTGLLGIVLTMVFNSPGLEISHWKIWGLPLLFVVWASVRQGILGGTAVAAVATVLCLAVDWLVREDAISATLQGNLLAQCVTALLVGASVTWIRTNEARYRQVVAHIPMVLYSARLFPGEGNGRLPRIEISFVSPASRAVLGAEPATLLGDFRNWLARVDPQDHELIDAALSQLCLDHKPVTCEYRVAGSVEEARPSTNGVAGLGAPSALAPAAAQTRWVRDTLVPHFGDTGQLLGWEGVLADITEQRALASDLRRATGMLQALVANLPAGVFFVHGPTGTPILVNARARQLLGQRTNAAAGLDHLSSVYRLFRPDGTLYPPDELPVSRALRQGLTGMRNDIVVHRPDGRRIPLVSWAAPIDLGGQGRQDAAVWVLEDLTALHQAEAARLDSEARLRAVIGTMAEGLIVQNGSGRIVDCNPAACDILGVSAMELRGQMFPGPGQGCVREDGSSLPAAEHPASLSLKNRQPVRDVIMGIPTAQQSVKWVLASSMPLAMTADPDQIRVVTTFADITAHRQALEVLRTSEEKYRGLVESLPLMLVQTDRELNISYMNPAFLLLTEYEVDELKGRDAWNVLVHPYDLPRVREAQRNALAGQTTRAEARFRIKDGSERICHGIYQPHRHNGQVDGISLLALDMTHQRHLERDLERAQRLDQVGRLAGGIAHDFNNLLTVILTLSELARSGLRTDDPVRDDLQRIGEAGDRAARLAGQLLTFSKQRPTVLRRIDVSRVAEKTLDLMRSSVPSLIHVEADLDQGTLIVEGDETQMQQVLMNLCLNACDAMPSGGCLRVRASLEDASFPPDRDAAVGPLGVISPTPLFGRAVLLSVSDTGHGMDESVCAQIFDPFFSTKEHGTGLGLTVVKQIVESFSGRIQVWSEPGQGTRFDIWLPALVAAECR
jgi:PAS domain S-box-containing protein